MIAELRRRTGLPVVECVRILKECSLDEYQLITRRTANVVHGAYSRGKLKVVLDTTEDDPRLATVMLRATLEADALLAEEDPEDLGFCHLFWRTKKRILRERYGVPWRTPAELNPDVCFD